MPDNGSLMGYIRIKGKQPSPGEDKTTLTIKNKEYSVFDDNKGKLIGYLKTEDKDSYIGLTVKRTICPKWLIMLTHGMIYSSPAAIVAGLCIAGTAAPVFAADPTSFNNSTASTVSGTHNETFTAGSDASQNQVGKETDQVLGGATASNPTETKSQNVSVYATKSSSVQLKVPQVLIGNATKSAYHVGVKGDITTKQTVTVTPAASFELKDVKDADRAAVKATIQQNKTSWSCTDLATAGSGNYVYAKGDITYPELHAGSYSGVFNLAVNLNYSAK